MAAFGRFSITGKRAQRDSEILDVAPLRLRFCAAKQMPLGRSIITAKSVSKYGVIPEKLIYGQALNLLDNLKQLSF
ncbi:MAG: hypothetical protein MUO63_01215 [Desulfobulbaceae bacterium]|nr:hypothetical protein [Desulfobulbaceae bacterium]